MLGIVKATAKCQTTRNCSESLEKPTLWEGITSIQVYSISLAMEDARGLLEDEMSLPLPN